jgi:hypothetical protein
LAARLPRSRRQRAASRPAHHRHDRGQDHHQVLGKHPGWAFFTSVPFGLTYTEQSAWINFLGGQQLWDELAGSFGLKAFPCGNTGVQMGGWFNKEIESADDLKGLKMRIPGLGGDVMAKVGASPVSLPGSQKPGLRRDRRDRMGRPLQRLFHEVLRGGQVLLLSRHA